MLDSLPPHNRDTERALLGSILRDQQIIDEVMTLIRAEDFYVFAHGVIFAQMADLARIGKQIDIITINESLMAKRIDPKNSDSPQLIDEVGGASYVVELFDAAPSAAHFHRYCELIRSHALRRGLIHTGTEICAEAADLAKPTQELLSAAERKIGELTERTIHGESVELQTALSETLVNMDARRNGELVGIPTGFLDLDHILCGLQKSELVIIGARPSTGKTAFAMQLALNAALDGNRVLFVSLEQARAELGERMLAMHARIDSHKLRKGFISTNETECLMQANEELGRAKFWIDDTTVQNVTRIAANARRMKRKRNIEMMVIDYLQLIDPEDKRAPRHEQVAAISRRLKLLARDLKIPVVCLAQLNRNVEERAGGKPRLSDLKESGSIEQDADAVLLLHRSGENDGATVEVIVAKNRNGRTGEIDLMFEKQFLRFENAAHQHSSYYTAERHM